MLTKLRTHLAWYKSHLTDYLRFKGGGDGIEVAISDAGIPLDAETHDLIEETVGRTFALERDLQAALRQSLDQLEDGLTVEDGGKERKVEAGFIDILARDGEGRLTVIELKTETSRPEVVAQTLAYMGCIAEETGEAVRGIIVAADHHPRVVNASKAVPNLKLQRYRYNFVFG